MSASPPVTDAIGLVLAAGAATRFGSPKALAEFRGRPLISWPIEALRAGGVDEITVVLGAAADQVAAALSDVRTVTAEDWSEGIAASLRAGVHAAAEAGAARVVVVLADQPVLSGAAVARVLEASRNGVEVARATYAGTPGHPTALAAATFTAVQWLQGDAGARRLTGFTAVDVPCDGLGSSDDVDTPADLARLQTSG